MRILNKKFTTFKGNRHQRGITLIEAVDSIAIFSTVALGAANLTNQAASDSKALVSAQYMQFISSAANSYITDNRAAVQAVATTTVPAMIPISTLRTADI